MPTIKRIEATLRARIKDIDIEIAMLRARQQGLERALMMVIGEEPLVEIKK